MTLREWRDLPSAEVLPLLSAERTRWLTALGWDLSAPLEIIEEARLSGSLPGYVAFGSDGTPVGWTYFVLFDGMLQIGGLAAPRPSVARALLDAVMDSPEAALARRLSCFVYPACDGVASAFTRQRFALFESLYLTRGLESAVGPDAPETATIRPWRQEDLPGLVRLLEAAYAGVPGADCFAPDGRRDQWAHYATQLVRSPACGVFDPSLSFVTGGEGRPLEGAVITTRLGPGTVHIAQVAVAPAVRRHGLAGALVGRANTAAAAAGFTTTTLMVDARNRGARALYASLGFADGQKFLFGQRAARTRLAA